MGRDREEFDEEEVEGEEEEVDLSTPDDDFSISDEQGEILERLLMHEVRVEQSTTMNQRIRQAFGRGG